MASEKDLELLDQYVSNRLAAQDRSAFEKKLEGDSSLRQELQIQKKLVEKIREARVSELKTMFNSIPTAELETGGTSVGTKVALWAAVAAVTGAGIYFYLTSSNDAASDYPAQEQVTEQAPENTTEQVQPPATSNDEAPAAQNQKPSDQAANPLSDNNEEASETAQAPANADSEESEKGPARLDVFDPTEEEKQSSNAKTPGNISEPGTLHKSSIAVEFDSNNKRYDFHYQFKDGKLLMYGTFEKNLYEIMEFFSDNKRTVFLYYKDSYYLLNEDDDDVKPLTPINDPALLKKLRDYRGTR
jgi:hypothetical protein